MAVSDVMQRVLVPVIVTDYGAVAISDRTQAILDGICPEWRKQVYSKRFRNKRVKEARRFMDDLETTARTINRILWTHGKPTLRVI